MSIPSGEIFAIMSPATMCGASRTVMDYLDYIEEQGRRNVAFSLETLELMNKRAHTLLTMLLGGAGASGSVALAQWAAGGSPWLVVPLAAVALWWFLLAYLVLTQALATQEVKAPAGHPGRLLDHLQGPLAVYAQELRAESGVVADTLTLLREGEIRKQEEAGALARAASSVVARALDRAYRLAACTPVVAVLAVLLVHWAR